MFGTILIIVVTLMQCYVFWRAASVPIVRRYLPRYRLIALWIGLWCLFLASRVNGLQETGSVAVVLEFLGMTWMAILFLMSVALIAVEVITGLGFFLARLVPVLRGAALVAGALLSVLALIQGMRAPVVSNYDVYLDGLPPQLDGMVIVALSDLHLGSLLGERWLAARVEQVRAQRPDVVVLLGDIIEGHSAPDQRLLAGLRRLSAPLGVWGVLGNHESHGADAGNSPLFSQTGIHLLRNAWVELRPGLLLAGVDDLSFNDNADETGSAIAQALAGRPPGVTVMLSHAPLLTTLFASKGVNLMLSGHTHGGQLWPFGLLVRQRFPLMEGRYEIGDMTLIVSRGTGTWGPRMRLWRPAEILRVTLHASGHSGNHRDRPWEDRRAGFAQ